MEKLDTYRSQLRGKNPEEVLVWALKEFGPGRIALASSFSIEDQVLTHMLVSADKAARIFTLDTGRLFQETYDVMQQTMEKYGMRFEVCFPDAHDVARLIAEDGPNLFYGSIGKRKQCCEVRKLRPLRKVLSTVDAWVCGLRRSQSGTRETVDRIEWDAAFGLYKINPLCDWTEEETRSYIRRYDVPYNALYDRGFRSIGCAPCTRATGDHEDIRAGRWWWESPEHKECGLHCAPQ